MPCGPSETSCLTKAGVSIRFDSQSRHASWWSSKYAAWEPWTFRAFEHFVGPCSIVLDVGGWIGATALWMSAVARRVVVLEPGSRAYGELELNAAKNSDRLGQLSLVRAALGPRRGFIKMT